MTTFQGLLFLAAWLSFATALLSATGAHLAADHSKRNGSVPKKTPDFFVFSTNVLLLGIVPSFSAIFSDAHRHYDSRFISRCVYVARTAFVLAAMFLVAVIAAVFVN